MASNKHKLIHHFLEQSAKHFPDKAALIHEDIRATYAQINSQADQLAYWLVDQGVGRGDRVVLILENSLEYVISYYGILKAGAVVAPLGTDLKSDSLRFLLKELEPKVVISSSRFERLIKKGEPGAFKISSLLLKNPKIKWGSASFSVVSWNDMISNEYTSIQSIPVDAADLSCIICTSGSTGQPKGVMLSHNNIVSNVHSICRSLHLTEKDIQMVVLPFFYVFGKSLLNTHFAVGGTVVISNKFAFPASVLQQMDAEQVSGFSGVPSTYAYLLHRSPLKQYKNRLESLRYCSQAGGHMSRRIKEELKEALPEHTKIYIMYGATEASARLTCLEAESFEAKMGSIGKPLAGITLRILDENGKEVLPGQTGEIVASGPNIMQGYWKDRKATENVLNRNGYYTGDIGFQDTEEFYYVAGRKDNILKVGGHRINPQEIEEVLLATELFVEVAVFGVADDMLGNKLVALTVPKNGECSEKLILSQCAKKLPKHKMPAEVKKIRSLPKNASGKVNLSKCLEIIGQ